MTDSTRPYIYSHCYCSTPFLLPPSYIIRNIPCSCVKPLYIQGGQASQKIGLVSDLFNCKFLWAGRQNNLHLSLSPCKYFPFWRVYGSNLVTPPAYHKAHLVQPILNLVQKHLFSFRFLINLSNNNSHFRTVRPATPCARFRFVFIEISVLFANHVSSSIYFIK